VPLVDHDQVNLGVVDLHLLQQSGHRWRRTPAARQARAASGPCRAVTCLTGSSPTMRRARVPREGTDQPRLRQILANFRYTAATDRLCRVRSRRPAAIEEIVP
jgi:hypothetical protein